jgi:hypothetical protein
MYEPFFHSTKPFLKIFFAHRLGHEKHDFAHSFGARWRLWKRENECTPHIGRPPNPIHKAKPTNQKPVHFPSSLLLHF